VDATPAPFQIRLTGEKMFTFQGFPMTLVVALIAMAWLSFLSVIFFG